MTPQRLLFPLLGALSAAVLATSTGPVFAQPPSDCGVPGKPPCPLQHWMRVNAAAPLAKRELEGLARAFSAIEQQNPNPKGWGNWGRIARDGEKAAREGSLSAARQQCGRCHRAYRRAYLLQYRARDVE